MATCSRKETTLVTIENFNSYEINRNGEIFSSYTNKLMKYQIDRKGYFRVTLRKNNKAHTVLVHRLIAKAFLPTEDYTQTVNHKDGNKLNNQLDNLEWMSLSDNVIHAYDTGLNSSKGENNNNSKLSNEKIEFIRASKEPSSLIAGMLGIHPSTVRKIRNKKLWVTTVVV